ncbi:MAG TPA: hypothetical protein DCX25_03375 [Candidatus Pacebacteria bacterium]|nr:MAG: hypothetical protein UX00_C0001G0044 [Microgenomates group bacterium GW2011_GWB1_45_17]KKU24236.1 MAG: hypothetical protein UX36_C0002G0219 [Microgenomates group bacterium GW2011_GWC1_46_15]KKU24952.1 MAG: hypothetical protein UX35_C0001G0134 [Microgenomates group bacterium GW2011_GWA1_46_15]HAV15346.1 hypothetical protein [Candidatus Paceibacterota bacterium]HCR11382.1 hypothetical protein [Candidatus Paceibacterota bacterium]
MHKQFFVLADYREKSIHWKAGNIVLVDPDIAVPFIGTILTPLYSAIKAGLYPPAPQEPLAIKMMKKMKENVKEIVGMPPESSKNPPPSSLGSILAKKKFLQNDIRAKIQAKKAERAQGKS